MSNYTFVLCMGIVTSAAITLASDNPFDDNDIDLYKSGVGWVIFVAGWVIFVAGVGLTTESIITFLCLVGVFGKNLE